jgi:hypothetical protein
MWCAVARDSKCEGTGEKAHQTGAHCAQSLSHPHPNTVGRLTCLPLLVLHCCPFTYCPHTSLRSPQTFLFRTNRSQLSKSYRKWTTHAHVASTCQTMAKHLPQANLHATLLSTRTESAIQKRVHMFLGLSLGAQLPDQVTTMASKPVPPHMCYVAFLWSKHAAHMQPCWEGWNNDITTRRNRMHWDKRPHDWRISVPPFVDSRLCSHAQPTGLHGAQPTAVPEPTLQAPMTAVQSRFQHQRHASTSLPHTTHTGSSR